MKKVLVITASARTLNSHTRKLTEVFINHWKSIHSNPIIAYRELGNTNVPHISESWITAASKPAAIRSADEIKVLQTSDAYIAELREADAIVLGTPMYNWSVPSALKAYIDQVLRVNETWKLNPLNKQQPYIGLLENKTLFLLLSRGAEGYEKGEYNEHLNFQSTYLKTVFNMIGISSIYTIAINGASFDPEQLIQSIAAAHQNIKNVLEHELVY